MLQIIDYQPVYKADWKSINEAWITKLFIMEDIDHQHCSQPEESILAGNGVILLAKWEDKIVGTVGLLRDDPHTFELIKMAVEERYRGQGFGEVLCKAAIQRAKDEGAKLLYLFSNRAGAVAAIKMYRRLGFVEVPLDRNDFARADIRMDMSF